MAGNRLQNQGSSEAGVSIVYDNEEAVVSWHLGQTQQLAPPAPGSYRAMGIMLDGKLIASVVYSRYRWPDMEIHIHTIDKRWCSRRTLKAIFSYPFEQMQCKRVTAITDPAKPAICHFLERIGFTEEGRLRNCLPHGDALVYGMLRGECKWVE